MHTKPAPQSSSDLKSESEVKYSPSKEEIASMSEFDRLPLNRIVLVSNVDEAKAAAKELSGSSSWGFDTESKPTFKVGEISDGPHVVQLSTHEKSWIFQLSDPGCRTVVCELLTQPGVSKVGFGLRQDIHLVSAKLGVEINGVVDINHLFKSLGYRKDIGVKTAVAVCFGQHFIKSKKASTSNWANKRLSDAQLLYAGNDAYAALRVYDALPQLKS